VILAYFAPILVLPALLCLLEALRSLGVYGRVLARKSRLIASLEPGPAEIQGVVRASAAPLQTFDGTPAVAIKTRIDYTIDAQGTPLVLPGVIDEVVAVEMVMSDDSGSVIIDATLLVLLGVRRRASVAGSELLERFPDLCKRASVSKTPVRAVIEETFIPDGAKGLASGHVELDDPTPGDGYRELRRRVRLSSTVGEPVLLTAFPEAETRSLLLRPSQLFAAVGALWLAAAGALLFAGIRIGE
jgi:hypothetical protein